jgi:phage shock protein A
MSPEESAVQRAMADSTRDSDVALAYMRTTSSRMDRIETDFVDHIRKIEDRLDQLVDLVRDVATLKQQYTAQNEGITELRGAIREQSIKMESSIARVHQRLDELTSSVSSSIDIETAKIVSKLGDFEKDHRDLDKRFQMWLNRGLGAWVAATIVVGILQYTGMKWIEQLDADKTASQAQIQKLSTRVADLEAQSLRQLESTSSTHQRTR